MKVRGQERQQSSIKGRQIFTSVYLRPFCIPCGGGMRMNRSKIKTYLLWILLAEAVGGLAGWLIREDVKIYTESIVQPPLSPPALVFPVVWTILYALMGISAARVALTPASQERLHGLWIFGLQLAMNFFWSMLFFKFQLFGLALIWLAALWGVILWMITVFAGTDTAAARLQIPYLVWVTFAGYLNLGVWILN